MRAEREGGFAMMVVMLGMTALFLIIILLFQQASGEYRNSQYQRREDAILAGADAMLERYAAKLTIDPFYYRRFVDDAELARSCTDTSSGSYGSTAQPGDAWFDDCRLWEYEDPGDFFDHPLLAGRNDISADDIASLITVEPNESTGGVTVTVLSQQSEFRQDRAVVADIMPEPISEFAWLQEEDLRFGSGVVVTGKVYVGGDLDFAQTPVRGIVHRNIFAEGAIGRNSGYGPPIFASGAQGYDGYGDYLDIREVYAEPLDFERFWDDLDLIREVACGGGGLCLSRALNPGLGLSANPTAWLIEPVVSGGVGQLRVSAAYSNSSYSCVDSEEWWFLNSQNASWTLVGVFPIADNPVVWADNHAVIGRPGTTATVQGAVTIYAGSSGARKNIVIGSDIVYRWGTSGTDVIGLIGSDEIYINPSSVGGDNQLTINAALLSQQGILGTGLSCGTDGSTLLPLSGGYPIAVLDVNGSIAKVRTGDLASHFGTRNYGFDARLERLRPPLFPLLQDTWHFENWRETTLPCWARASGSPGC